MNKIHPLSKIPYQVVVKYIVSYDFDDGKNQELEFSSLEEANQNINICIYRSNVLRYKIFQLQIETTRLWTEINQDGSKKQESN